MVCLYLYSSECSRLGFRHLTDHVSFFVKGNTVKCLYYNWNVMERKKIDRFINWDSKIGTFLFIMIIIIFIIIVGSVISIYPEEIWNIFYWIIWIALYFSILRWIIMAFLWLRDWILSLRPLIKGSKIYRGKYQEYLQTDIWRTLSEFKLREFPNCQACRQPATVVHHLSYKRIWAERANDIVSVCYECHEKCHFDYWWNKISLDEKSLRERFYDIDKTRPWFPPKKYNRD